MEERVAQLEAAVEALQAQLTQMIDALYESNEHYQTINTEVNSTIKNDMGNMDGKITVNANGIADANSAIDDLAVAILEGGM